MYVYIYIYIYIHMYMHIYIGSTQSRHRQRRAGEASGRVQPRGASARARQAQHQRDRPKDLHRLACVASQAPRLVHSLSKVCSPLSFLPAIATKLTLENVLQSLAGPLPWSSRACTGACYYTHLRTRCVSLSRDMT